MGSLFDCSSSPPRPHYAAQQLQLIPINKNEHKKDPLKKTRSKRTRPKKKTNNYHSVFSLVRLVLPLCTPLFFTASVASLRPPFLYNSSSSKKSSFTKTPNANETSAAPCRPFLSPLYLFAPCLSHISRLNISKSLYPYVEINTNIFTEKRATIRIRKNRKPPCSATNRKPQSKARKPSVALFVHFLRTY